jgi:hypothetical protein
MKRHIVFKRTIKARGIVEGNEYVKGMDYWVDVRDADPYLMNGIAVTFEQAQKKPIPKPAEPKVVTKPVSKKRTYKKRTYK